MQLHPYLCVTVDYNGNVTYSKNFKQTKWQTFIMLSKRCSSFLTKKKHLFNFEACNTLSTDALSFTPTSTSAQSRMQTDRHMHTQRTSTVTLAAHVCQELIVRMDVTNFVMLFWAKFIFDGCFAICQTTKLTSSPIFTAIHCITLVLQ